VKEIEGVRQEETQNWKETEGDRQKGKQEEGIE
jgi:hypothetical protein